MATIRTAIQIQDNFSNALINMGNLLANATVKFTELQNVINRDTKFNGVNNLKTNLSVISPVVNNINNSIQNVNNTLNNTTNNFNNINHIVSNVNNNMINVVNNQNNLNNSLKQGQTHADGLASKIGNAVKAYLGFQAVKGVADASDSYILTQARLGLMNDGLQTTAQLNDKIFQSAERSRSSYTETAKSVAKLGILAKDAFSSNEETVAFAEQMNKQFKIGGASIQEQTAGMYQLTQAMASGKLQGDEFRSIKESAPLLAQAISQFTGKSMGELNKMSSEGQITASIIKQSLFAAADEANAKFEALPKTIGDVGTKIKNNAMKIFAPILTRINEVVNFNFDSIVGNILSVMSFVANVAANIINIGVSIGTFFQNNWGMIAPIVWGIVGAIAAYSVVMGICKMVTAGMAIAEGIKATATLLSSIATGTATTAQWGLNSAMYACPIFWIIAAIVAVIAYIYLAVAAINKVQNKSYSATGFIAGCFMALQAVIYNVVAFLWNTFAIFYEYFLNVGEDKTYAAKKLFTNLAINVNKAAIAMAGAFDKFATSMGNAMIDGINVAIRAWNTYMDLLDKAGIAEKLGLKKGTEIQHTQSIVSNMDDVNKQLEENLGEAPNGYKTVPRMEYKDAKDEFNKGYQGGYGISNTDNLKLPGEDKDPTNYEDLLKNAENVARNTGDIAGNTGDTAGNTGAIKDSLDISDEDLKYLRDIAEREVINKFTTVPLKVEMTNHNNISNDMDIYGIINSLGEGVYEGLQTVAEGATYDV